MKDGVLGEKKTKKKKQKRNIAGIWPFWCLSISPKTKKQHNKTQKNAHPFQYLIFILPLVFFLWLVFFSIFLSSFDFCFLLSSYSTSLFSKIFLKLALFRSHFLISCLSSSFLVFVSCFCCFWKKICPSRGAVGGWARVVVAIKWNIVLGPFLAIRWNPYVCSKKKTKF